MIRGRGSIVGSTSSSSLGARLQVGVEVVEFAERRVARLDLDPDVEHLAVLAVAGAHQLEVPDEPAGSPRPPAARRVSSSPTSSSSGVTSATRYGSLATSTSSIANRPVPAASRS